MSETLFALVATANGIENMLLETAGEITPEIEAALAVVDVNLPAKVDSYAFVIDRLEAQEAFWKLKANELYKIASSCKTARERIKDSIKDAISALGADEIRGNEVRFKMANSRPRLVIDEDALPKEYMMQIIHLEADKKRIEEDLKLGIPVEGATYQETKSLRTYAVNAGSKK